MAITKSQTQVKWSTANSESVAAGGNSTSDDVAINDAAVAGSVQIKADNGGTPAAGDELHAHIQYSNGDPDADPDSADEFDDNANTIPFNLDTDEADPAILTIPINPSAKKFRIYVISQASSNSITVSAQYSEQVVS